MQDLYSILIKPLLTEKVTRQQEGQEKVTFMVARRATKHDIARAVEHALGVHVEKVNVLHVRGKVRRMGQIVGKAPDWKKAVITLRKGEKVELLKA